MRCPTLPPSHEAIHFHPSYDNAITCVQCYCPEKPTGDSATRYFSWLVLWTELHLFKIHMLKFYAPVPQDVTVFGDKVFKQIIYVNEVIGIGPFPI